MIDLEGLAARRLEALEARAAEAAEAFGPKEREHIEALADATRKLESIDPAAAKVLEPLTNFSPGALDLGLDASLMPAIREWSQRVDAIKQAFAAMKTATRITRDRCDRQLTSLRAERAEEVARFERERDALVKQRDLEDAAIAAAIARFAQRKSDENR